MRFSEFGSLFHDLLFMGFISAICKLKCISDNGTHMFSWQFIIFQLWKKGTIPFVSVFVWGRIKTRTENFFRKSALRFGWWDVRTAKNRIETEDVNGVRDWKRLAIFTNGKNLFKYLNGLQQFFEAWNSKLLKMNSARNRFEYFQSHHYTQMHISVIGSIERKRKHTHRFGKITAKTKQTSICFYWNRQSDWYG